MTNVRDFGALNWVKDEIDATIGQARRALEEQVDDAGSGASLQLCAESLHQIAGVLQMVEAYGPAMLAEEMEQVARAMFKRKVRQHEDAAEALMLALIQLPDYLEKLQAGDEDVPLIVLPLLNDLRAVRDAPLLSEAALFNPDLENVAVPDRITGEPNDELPDLVRRVRQKYHLGLLNWYRKLNLEKGWSYLLDVAKELERGAGTEQVHRLMWVAGAVIQGLIEGSIQGGVAVKQLLGKLDRELRLIIDQGERALVDDPPHELIKNLLYYVGRAESQHPHLLAVKEAYNLSGVLPSESALAKGRESLTGTNAELVHSVREAIYAELTQVKDILDLFMRGEQADPSTLDRLQVPMQRLADTLGMIGQGALRSRLIRQAEKLESFAKRSSKPEEFELMEMAGDILFVESSLSGIHSGQQLIEDVEASSSNWGQTLPVGEFEGLVKQTVKEAKIDIAKAKEAIVNYTETDNDPAVLEEVFGQFTRVYGALKLLDFSEPAEIARRTTEFIHKNLIQGHQIPGRQQLNSLADVISSIEYFLEALVDGVGDRKEIIEIARTALSGLVQEVPGMPEEEPVPAPVVEIASVREAQSQPEELFELEQKEEAEAVEEGPVEEEPDSEGLYAPLTEEEKAREIIPSAEKPALEEIDPEILEIFVEEAREELEVVQENLPRWRRNFDDKDALITIRRSFHTLKGSGRLVGAKMIGELAWSVENMLNRIIDETIEVTPEVLSILADVEQMLPVLIDCQERSVLPDLNVVAVMDQAFALIDGRSSAAAKSTLEIAEGETTKELAEAQGEVLEEPSSVESFDLFESSSEEIELAPLEDETIDVEELPLDEPVEIEASIQEPDSARLAVEAAVKEALLKAEAEAEAEAELSGFSDSDLVFELDTELLAVFKAETAAHFETLHRFIDDARLQTQRPQVDETVPRAFHTLRGSAHMTGLTPIAEINQVLESYINQVIAQRTIADDEVLGFIEDGIAATQGTLGWLLGSNEAEPDIKGLVARLEAAEMILKAEAEAEPISAEEFEKLPDEEAEELFIAAGDEADSALIERVEEEALSQVEEDGMFAVAEDPELVEVFVEEAKELLEQIESSYQHWMDNQSDESAIDAIQRILHTLKGSARLSGILPVGDLSHALESLFSKIADKNVLITGRLLELTRQAIDRIAHQIDEVATGGALSRAGKLVKQLESILGSKEASAEISSFAAEPTDSLLAPSSIDEFEADSDFAMLDAGLTTDLAEETTQSEETAETEGAESALEPEVEPEPEPGESEALKRIIRFPKQPQQPPAPAQENLPQGTAFRPARDQVRVSATLLDRLVNNAGEISIYRARLEQQNGVLGFNLAELEQTITRLFDQLRKLEIETEAQILYRWDRDHGQDDKNRAEFDPLELDRFSTMQQLSRALMETVNDLGSINGLLADLQRETDTLLLQQSRISTDLQDGLLRTRMVPFQQLVPRLQRVVRQTADQLGKKANLETYGTDGEMDRTILNRMIPALEHLLRNAVSHGIEKPEARRFAEKDEAGRISLYMTREATDIVLTLSDDGNGLDINAIREKAIAQNLIDPNAQVEDDDLMQCVLMPGFSTASEVTQIAGRGVGLDVVSSEVKQLGGSLDIDSQPGRGTSFTIRLPLTLAITDALLMRVGDDVFAIPHGSVEGVVRISRSKLIACESGEEEGFSYAGRTYKNFYLGSMLGLSDSLPHETEKWIPLLLVQSGERRVALRIDELLGTRQIVVKSVGKQVSSVPWITGGTILADGRVALILDVGALVRLGTAHLQEQVEEGRKAAKREEERRVRVMVVDDSITVRKVTSRLLERHDMDVVTAKDGVDAVALLQEQIPDIMLLDIEMPRMDGFELARHVHNSVEYYGLPIIMISSRVGEKHRKRAFALGVRRCLGKPYQEAELLENIKDVLAESET